MRPVRFSQLFRPQEAPNLRQMPIDHWVYPHEIRPALVRAIKVRQVLPVGIRPPRPHEDGFDSRIGVEVDLEGVAKRDAGDLVRWGGGDVC